MNGITGGFRSICTPLGTLENRKAALGLAKKIKKISKKAWTILQTILWKDEIKINFYQKDGKLAEGEKTVHY